jgi:signal transduction histidine kinase
MRKTDLRYWVLWLFLLGIIFIVFLQVISGYNITRLMQGNSSLTEEMQLQNNLRQLQNDVLAVESDIRGLVITNDPGYTAGVPEKINSINARVKNLSDRFRSSPFSADYRELQNLITRKNAFSSRILDAVSQNDKSAAEALIKTNRGRELRDSMEATLLRLDQLRQAELKNITGSIEESGKSTRIWGFGIGGIALLAVVSAFWYMLDQGKQQQKMITLLNESDKKSKELANMKEQFLANMSHEIRTPMNAILGFTNLLRRSPLNTEQRQYVQNIHSAGENLLALVNDILDLSKIEAGMMSLEETRFSLHSLMSSVGAMFGEKVKEKGLQFRHTH